MKIEKQYEENFIVYNFLELPINKEFSTILLEFEKDTDVAYTIILDFKQIETFEINMYKFFKEIYKKAIEKSTDVIICGLNDQPTIVVEVIRISELFEIVNTIENAKDIIEKRYDNALYSY